jgi:hypothetical protein
MERKRNPGFVPRWQSGDAVGLSRITLRSIRATRRCQKLQLRLNKGPERRTVMDSQIVKFALPALISLALSATSAAAVEQNCRFIQAKADRESCYKRQEDELAAKRKPVAPVGEGKALESVQQMRQDDDAIYRSINNICRGC